MVVLTTPSVVDGPVIRWYPSESEAAELFDRPIVSASAHGVRINCWLHDLPDGLLETARWWWQVLRVNKDADISRLATHTRYYGGHLEPIVRPAEGSEQ